MKRKKITFTLELIVPRAMWNSDVLLRVKTLLNKWFYKVYGEKTGVEKIEVVEVVVLDK